MSDFGAIKQPETTRVTEPKKEEPKAAKKDIPQEKPVRKAVSTKDSSDSSTKALQALQKQISRVDETTADVEKQLKMLDKIQSEVSRFEGRLSQIEKTSQDTLAIVKRIKIKKKKGKNEGKKSKK